MFVLESTVRASIALAAASLVAGCGGAGTPVGAPAPIDQGSARAIGEKNGTQYNGKVFVSDLINDAVWICPANFYDIRNGFTYPTGQLSGVSNPVQIAVDREGTVYVANA
ncbi:MAG: hypothetical protein JO104_02550, partial [Candidatus Eremiobacteraeota bacterium]|nr:hypothetical protein [Candidatus Eremiobacteraeota bacterium]